jgi:hypothetical protein
MTCWNCAPLASTPLPFEVSVFPSPEISVELVSLVQLPRLISMNALLHQNACDSNWPVKPCLCTEVLSEAEDIARIVFHVEISATVLRVANLPRDLHTARAQLRV